MTTRLASGTVRAQFEQEDGRAEKARRMSLLSRTLEEFNVSGDRVWMVERMMDLVDGTSDHQTWCATVGMTAVVLAIEQGNTGLPVDTTADGDGFRGQLEVMLETAQRIDESGEALGVSVDEVIADFVECTSERSGPFARLVGGPADYAPLVRRLGGLYTHKTDGMEQDVADRLGALVEADAAHDAEIERADEAIAQVLDSMPFEMDRGERDTKREALQALTGRRFSIVTGGAGTGKTTLVLAVLRVLERLSETASGVAPEDVALAAPTGKAAKRLEESIRDQMNRIDGDERLDRFRDELDTPQTLHRLLDYSPYYQEFRRDEVRPLEAELVVVDEATMVDLELMRALTAALPDGGRLMLVGDAGQLPSVQAGAVFHDLSDGEHGPELLEEGRVFLEKSHRTSSPEILDTARAVRNGEATVEGLEDEGTLQRVSKLNDERTNSPVTFVTSDDDTSGGDDALEGFLQVWWHRHYGFLTPDEDEDGEDGETPVYRRDNYFEHTDDGGFTDETADELEDLFDAIDAAQLLSVTRRRTRGAGPVNGHMHRAYMESNGLDDPDAFERGEPVIITENDYEEDVFNGEQGIVLYTLRPDERGRGQGAKKRVVVRDGEGFRAIHLSNLRDKIQHAYALTVHKSQGSEYGHVGLLMPELLESEVEDGGGSSVHPLVTREILYTAITRAKESVTLFGDERVFDEGSERTAGRYSGVGRRIKRVLSEKYE